MAIATPNAQESATAEPVTPTAGHARRMPSIARHLRASPAALAAVGFLILAIAYVFPAWLNPAHAYTGRGCRRAHGGRRSVLLVTNRSHVTALCNSFDKRTMFIAAPPRR